MTVEAFRDDRKTVDAVIRNLEVIGEAAKQLSPETRERIGGIEWQRIAGLRDILIHQYFAVDVDIVWDIVVSKVLLLESAVRAFRDGG